MTKASQGAGTTRLWREGHGSKEGKGSQRSVLIGKSKLVYQNSPHQTMCYAGCLIWVIPRSQPRLSPWAAVGLGATCPQARDSFFQNGQSVVGGPPHPSDLLTSLRASWTGFVHKRPHLEVDKVTGDLLPALAPPVLLVESRLQGSTMDPFRTQSEVF